MFSAISHFVFGASSLFGANSQNDGIRTSTWKDKKLCFDLRSHDLELGRGEQLIGCFYPIEDVKGNQDELGLIKVTNLRLIWVCCKKRRVNLSIGWRTVTLAYEQSLKDAFYGSSSSMFVLSKYEGTKYEFVFRRQASQVDIWSTAADNGNASDGDWNSMAQLRQFSKDKGANLISHLSPMYLDDPFEVIFKVWQAYKQTYLFRHCRSNLTHLVSTPDSSSNFDGSRSRPTAVKLSDIQRLPSEEIIEVFPSVAHVESRSVRHTGTMLLSNVRIIWIDDGAPMRNFSIPYIRVDWVKQKPGDRVLVSTHDHLASSSCVEFLVAQKSKAARSVFEQLQNLYLLYKSKPRYGPESCEDGINFMSHLRPIEQYFDSVDRSLLRAMDNFGPEATTVPASEGQGNIQVTQTMSAPGASKEDDDVERAERDLGGYTTKVMRYLNENPSKGGHELIYWNDLGLAMEKPMNGASISSIWKIHA